MKKEYRGKIRVEGSIAHREFRNNIGTKQDSTIESIINRT